jgi:hypothetical protein
MLRHGLPLAMKLTNTTCPLLPERVLLPEVRSAALSTLLVSDGFGCKQISQRSNRHALHLAEVLYLAQQYGPEGPGGIYPENVLIEPRRLAVQQSMKRAGIVAAATLGIGLLAAWLWRTRR